MTQKSLAWRFPLIAVVIAVCFMYAWPPFGSAEKPGKIKLGLDLQGGMHLALRVDTSKLSDKAKVDATDRAMEVLRNRIDQFGVAEPSIQREGSDRIVIQLPGVTDRERALALLGKTALLEFMLVDDDPTRLKDAIAGNVPDGYILAKEDDGRDILLEDKILMTGKYLVNAAVDFGGNFNEPIVNFELNAEGGKIFSQITGANVNRRLAIVLDGKVQSAPNIESQISDRGIITGRFSFDQANDLAIVLRAGALPAPIIVEEERSVGPSLGKDSVEQGVGASVIGFAAVVGFMVVYYLFGGIIASLALLLNILIILASLAYFKATLTLPGIAGTVLTIGMAVDANVLIFERIREELALKKPMAAALKAGYEKAFITIFDANLTTLITAAILYYMGSGPIKGFALTLAIGLIASMFTAVFVTRAFFDLLLFKGGMKNLRMLDIFNHLPAINFLKVRKICYGLSLAVIVVGIFSMIQRGEKLFGVEFSGGTMQEYRFNQPVSVEDIRRSLAEAGHGTATIQKAGERNEIFIRSSQGSETVIQEKIKKDMPKNSFEVLRIESVGPVIGHELRTKAVWALILSLLGIWIYVVWRFDFKYAFGASLALLHDGLVALGFVALTGRELSIPVLAAVLTILGFSVNDTIVIFDRIRERRRLGSKETFEQTVNNSINLTMSRTILTTLTVFMVILSLFFKGGEVINDFAFTMLVGVISGTYSTIYIAAPVLIDWPGSKKK